MQDYFMLQKEKIAPWLKEFEKEFDKYRIINEISMANSQATPSQRNPKPFQNKKTLTPASQTEFTNQPQNTHRVENQRSPAQVQVQKMIPNRPQPGLFSQTLTTNTQIKDLSKEKKPTTQKELVGNKNAQQAIAGPQIMLSFGNPINNAPIQMNIESNSNFIFLIYSKIPKKTRLMLRKRSDITPKIHKRKNSDPTQMKSLKTQRNLKK
jgi:hypothetical protein